MTRNLRTATLSPLCSAAAVLLLVAPVRAVPAISQLSLRGLQTGATTTLVIEGADLPADTRVLLPVPIARQEPRPASTANRLEIDITLDATVVPGIYPLRVGNGHGVSNAMLVGIDHLPERPFALETGALPVALDGTLAGGTILRTAFDGKAGERIVVDVESHRLGSKLNPVVHLLDARNAQLAWGQMNPAIAGDARLQAILPADGRYTVELHDALYRGEGPGAFRLKIGDIHFADHVFPLGGRRGTHGLFELTGTNLAPGQMVEADLAGGAAALPARWPVGQVLTGSRPQILVGDLPEVSEHNAGPNLQAATAPVVINGRLLAAREEDRYLVNVTPGQTLRFDCIAAQAGSPLDGVLDIRKESGEQLASADDAPTTTDPTLDFKVPDGVTKVVAAVRDLQRRGGTEYAYRLSIAPADRPDFRLEIFADREQVPTGGAEIVRVRAQRMGYQGAIKLAVEGLPPGVTVAGDEIPAGATDALLTLAASGAASQAIATITGTAADPNVALVRTAQTPESPGARSQPWLRSELAVAATGAASLSVRWDADSAGVQLPLGSRVPARVKITRAPFAGGAVRLSLLTSQITPKKVVTKNNQKQQVDDTDRTLRFDGMPTIAPDQSDLVATILVPGDLPNIPYDLAIRAELLAADGKNVVASVVTPARRLTTVQPLRLALVGEAKVAAKAGTGDTGKLTGKIERIGDFPHPVTVTLTGLPADYLAPTVEVPAGASDFSLPVAFPYNSAQGELAGVSIVATARPGGGAAINSNAVPVAVNVVAGGPPPALYRIFEDEPHFVTLLNEGGGAANLESTDRYSGPAALRVTPDQKFRAKLPGLSIKIAEHPAEGEYRYLRYAWKKIGGGSVLLQLNANGTWGPTRGQGKPGYRYEAGPAGNTFNAEAIRTSDRLPYGWTVVTRDLFADFGAFELDGLAFTPGDGTAALFDSIYLARSMDDFKDCPAPLPAEQPLAVFEDQPEFIANLSQGAGTASLDTADRFTGATSVKITPEQRYNPALPGLGVKIRQNPAAGEYRYLQFAWKKHGGQRLCVQLNHDGQWGPVPSTNPLKFRYDAGAAPGETFGGAMRIDGSLPNDWVVVTRDLFADFGEFTLTGLALAPVDGDFALFDHIYLGRTPRDFDQVAQ
ncbi:MAG TPA: hypothetical protein VHD36_10915 [Pirellulales bacterium]|nr:hypothetical protein [Pirellulales bacterium]